MNKAVESAQEICRKVVACRKTQSELLKRDYEKSINNDYRELVYYCKALNISVYEVLKKAVAGD